MERSCCFTGYRPEKFPFPLKLGTADFNTLENKIYNAVFALASEGVDTFYCGMAAGFDLLCGKAVIDLKRVSPENEIKLIAAIPFKGQSVGFSPMWKRLYDIVLNEADKAVILSDEYQKGCFSKRNRYMVDRSAIVLCYFDGVVGGTANTLHYATSKGLRIINIADYDLTNIYNNYSGYQLEFEEY